MVRQLLGNIRGPKGDTGDVGPKGDDGVQGPRGLKGDTGDTGPKGDTGSKGDDGGFNGEIIGVNNLFNMSDVRSLYNDGNIDYDINSGMLTFTDITWNIRTPVRLNNRIHTLYIKDYESNPSYWSGSLRVNIVDTNGDDVTPQTSYQKDIPLTIDLTNRGNTEDYELVMRVTNATAYSGYIEQPMLVEGDYTSGWQPSLKDSGPYGADISSTGERFLTTDDIPPSSTVTLTSNMLSNIDSGTYLFTHLINTRGYNSGVVRFDYLLNGVRLTRCLVPAEDTALDRYYAHVNLILNVDNNNSELIIEVLNESDDTIDFVVSDNNYINLVKLI